MSSWFGVNNSDTEAVVMTKLSVQSTHDPAIVLHPVMVAVDHPAYLVFHVHGGGFGGGELAWGVTVAEMLSAKLNATVVACDFRKDAHPNASNDIVDTINHVVKETTSWQPPVVLSGSSSGGWHAMAVASECHKDISVPITAVVALCPVTDPSMRMAYLDACRFETPFAVMPTSIAFAIPTRDKKGATVIKNLQDNYFGLSPNKVRPPPPHTSTLIIAGGHDKNVPLHILLHAMSWATQTVVLGEQGHEIQSKLTDVALDAVASFLKLKA
jgi:acetyl esterase/lipase